MRKQKRQRRIFYGCVAVILAAAALKLLLPKPDIPQTAIMENTESSVIAEEISAERDETEAMAEAESEYQRIISLDAGELAVTGSVPQELAERLFYGSEIDEKLSERITGYSYTVNDNIQLSDLVYLRMLYYNADGNTCVGEMIVNRKIETEVLAVFQALYENQYPIERMVLIDNYNAEDEASMEDNNTSAFNYRTISGSNKLSNHSYGMAIDLNPKYNPYVKTASDGSVICQPQSGSAYADRTQDFEYKIDENDLAYQLFTQAGFTWGGSWDSVKDYQHFEKEMNP